ncbi:hypothetical protein GCK72_015521 [Caenorhabditis remanei]|uniref:Uncharacterized protein n=1 Tax=Caenorhabditis remanei TaxID=31234 RepID=A0A6A5GWR4_CAERE|nr:hypothetical protein GCK72_015521 [Caenorhabditis remanei]KAF1759061.1 hypothetical protein GCK72_015521 [Caenorhabditis remanei]
MAHDKGVGGVGMRRDPACATGAINWKSEKSSKVFWRRGQEQKVGERTHPPSHPIWIVLLVVIALRLLRRLVGRILHDRRQRLEIRRNNEEVRADNAAVINEVVNFHQFLLEASVIAQDDTQIIISWSHS